MPLIETDDVEDEIYEILDLSDHRNPRWVRQLLGDVSRQSTGKQLLIGGASGWCAGYVFSRVGKVAAAALGTSLILIQVAQYNGYINVNWNNVNKSVKRAKRKFNHQTGRNISHYMNQMKDFFQDNVFVAGGFAGGFLLGLAT